MDGNAPYFFDCCAIARRPKRETSLWVEKKRQVPMISVGSLLAGTSHTPEGLQGASDIDRMQKREPHMTIGS